MDPARKNARDISQIGESGFLELIRNFSSVNQFTELGMGDDGAILRRGRSGGRIVITTDMLIQGVHFSLDYSSFRELGRKSYEVNASDLAAMGARPTAAFLSLGVKPSTPLKGLRDFYKGFLKGAVRHGCIIAGGDTVRADSLTVSVTLVGLYAKRSRPCCVRGPVRASGSLSQAGPGKAHWDYYCFGRTRRSGQKRGFHPL